MPMVIIMLDDFEFAKVLLFCDMAKKMNVRGLYSAEIASLRDAGEVGSVKC